MAPLPVLRTAAAVWLFSAARSFVEVAAEVCKSNADRFKTSVGIGAALESDTRGQVQVEVLCGEDAAQAAARAATARRSSTKRGEAVLACAKTLHIQLEKEAETGQIGYIAPAMLDQGTKQERYRLLKTGGQFSRRAAEHARKDEFTEAIADLLRALLRPNVDQTARDKLMSTMNDFLNKAALRRKKAAEDGDLTELFEDMDMEDSGEDNTDVDRSALKRTYRELSVKYHPDKNPESADRFNRIRDAYEILSDPVKMLLFDTGGLELVKKYEKDGDGEIERTPNLEEKYEISLEDAYIGGEREIRLNRRVVCRSCRVRPDLPRCKACKPCPGERRQRQVWMDQFHYRVEEYEEPSQDKCTWDRQSLKVQIEKGIMFGDRAHYPHLGSQLPKKIPGDALVTFKVKKDSTFKRLGNDLMVDLKISLYEALLGFKRELVHLDGHIVEFNVPRGEVLKPGAALEIEGEGMPLKEDPSSAGKLIIRFEIDFPKAVPESAADALEAAMQALPGMASRPSRVGGHRRTEL